MTGPEEFAKLREAHKARHYPAFTGGRQCAECGSVWPCTMSRALDQIEEMKEALRLAQSILSSELRQTPYLSAHIDKALRLERLKGE